ncbi:SDR family oxidoreductase [Rhizosaccharibacter radicis]|uniref:SDR family oxidoreductase n=1 Tax=Rhizosaccharibacter radicis TaxID=2782605 RepID=A0ABT1W247_9PROT|nr:SDR family oxidoreductase [Acetobacteraceae bacterium KSS12]
MAIAAEEMRARTALVTGAGSGIGAGIAARLVHDGWTVFAVDQDEDALARRRTELPALRTIVADVGEEASVRDAVRAVAEQCGGRLHGLVSNAGIMVRKPLEQLTLAEWNRVLSVNLTAGFLLARECAPLLRRTRGAIVTISSTRAHMSEPDTESYSASKGGILALTHALAVSLGPEIRANCVSPGWIDVRDEKLRPEDHEQHPAGRVGRPDDIAALAAWLLGPDSGFVTGAEFVSDGGMTRRMIYAD